jgi:type I restriction enzyme S subunit
MMTYNADDWETKSLGDIASFQNGYGFSKDQWEDEGVPIIRIQNLTGTGEGYNYYSGEVDEKYHVSHGDILFSWSGTIEAFRWSGQDAILNQHIYNVDPDENEVTEDFIYWLLKHAAKTLERKKVGGALQHIRKSHVTGFDVQIPPIDEQHQIVNEIEDQIGAIDELENTVNSLERKVNEYGDAAFSHLFHGQNDLSDETVAGTPTEADVPDNWDVERLGDVAEINPRISYSEDRDKYPHVPMDGVNADTQEIDYFEGRDSVYSSLAKFEQDDVLFARITPCMENGKVALVEELPEGEDMSFGSTELAVIRAGDELMKEFVYNYLSSKMVRAEAENTMTGAAGRKRVPLDYLKEDLQIPVPPLDEQAEIVNQLESVREKLSTTREAIDTVGNRFDEYRDSVLHHAFRGELHTEGEISQEATKDGGTDRPESGLDKFT